MRRLVLVRHGESDGNSKERLVGSGDPALSSEGRQQMLAARAALAGQVIDLVVASPSRRAWQSALVLTGGASLRLESDFREVHFGRWEGKTVAEVEAADPVRFQQWRELAPDFEYPGGEPRAAFRARVERGLERVLAANATAALVVGHKGVIRAIVQKLTGTAPDRERPALGEAIVLTRQPGGTWVQGRRSSDPPALEAQRAAV